MSEKMTVRVVLSPKGRSTPVLDRASGPSEAPRPDAPAISAAAKALALAHLVERALLEGEVRSYKEAAQRLGISEARVNQLSALMSLSPRVVEAVLLGEIDASIRDLQWAARSVSWSDQEKWIGSRHTGV